VIAPVESTIATVLSSADQSTSSADAIGFPRASSARTRIDRRPPSFTTMRLSPDSVTTCSVATRGRTSTCERARRLPTAIVMVVRPGPFAMTVPLGSAMATLGFSLVQVGRAPMSTVPFRSVMVAARCSVSPIDVAVSAVGRSPTHAAPRLPMVLALSGSPMIP
jgi:hypothetical protein